MNMLTVVKKDADLLTLGRGAARGMASGLAASWVMNRFQDRAQGLFGADGSSGDPATVKAADRVTMTLSGRHLKGRDKDVAGSAVHYAVGTLTGGLFGALAEVRPGVTRWRGAAMGIAAATLVDQLAVPAAGLARPPWKYSLGTHLYGYASHVVFGMATDAIRRLLQDRATVSPGESKGVTLEDWALPLMLGLANGQRTMTPAAAVSITAASAGLDLEGGRLAFLSSPWTAAAFGAAALGEYYVDIRPGTPARIEPMGVAARMAGGALAGAATARPDKHVLAAVVGAGGALAGAYISYRVRMRMARAFGADRRVGVAEDMLSLAGSLALAGFAALRARRAEALG